jgi:hypothetical protein
MTLESDLDEVAGAPGDGDVADVASRPERADQPEVGRSSRWTRLDWAICAGLMLLSIVLVGLHVRAYTTLSPIDELQHVDYMIKAGELEIPREGDLDGYEALEEAACRSVDSPGYAGPECGLDSYDPGDFQELGYNTAAGQFPLYYVLTGVAARGLTAVGLFDSKVTAGRMIGAVWAGLAWCVLWYVMSLLRVPRWNRVIAIGLLMFTPLTLFHAATINADAFLLLAGSLAVLATMLYERETLPGWALLGAYAALVLIDPTNLLVTCACATYLAVRANWSEVTPSLLRRLTPIAGLVLMLLVRQSIAPRIRDTFWPPAGSTAAAPMNSLFVTSEVSIDKVVAQLGSVFTPVNNPYVSPPLESLYTWAFIDLVNWLLIAVMFAGAFVVAGRAQIAWLARVGMAAMLLAGPFYTWYYAYYNHADFPAPARFGLPLLAIVVPVVGASLVTRPMRAVAAVLAAGAASNIVFQLLTA